ncbi:MAG: tRNA uridine-5-carboxymethylaminomethyl(34) synthesis GTPase MnmE, partial [Nitrospira sp.]|nr:tRNA uridine-5-carboxymethylaminomethyl(34) synthesis GTPase MnmE [Nitrospira sp.]
MGNLREDTICGIATALGEGGIGIVRISGSEALSVAERVVRLRSRQSLASLQSHRLHLADVVLPGKGCDRYGGKAESALHESEIIDEALVVCMRAPSSYTAEDIVEIHSHGGTIVLGLVSEACVLSGARLAEPGEFSQRAFLNGRIDLSQAEAVLDTIRAKSEAGLRLAQRHLRGELGREVSGLRACLLALLSQIEAGIDFSEEDISFVEKDVLCRSLDETIEKIDHMLRTADRGIRLRDGARVVIAGPPNVGKSSVLNALLGQERAIVTDIPGTTRDVIEESLVWGGLRMTLVDTAGVRDTDDVVEREGIKRTRSAVDEADVVVEVADASMIANAGGWRPVSSTGRVPEILVLNKSDLVDEECIVRLIERIGSSTESAVIATSVRTGVGLERLRQRIEACLLGGILEPVDDVVVMNLRHRDALARAQAGLVRGLEAVRNGAALEL